MVFVFVAKQVLPDAIAGLVKLEELDVSSNLLETLPDSIGLLTTLKILNVSSNKLNSLPESIAFCKYVILSHLPLCDSYVSQVLNIEFSSTERW